MFCYLVLSVEPSLAQEKFESEERVKPEEVPSSALEFVGEANVGKLKWYRETSGSGTTYEAKFKWNGRRHSVEFDSSGTIEDIELIWKKGEMEEAVLQAIDSTLDSLFIRYKFRKIQKQYPGSAEELMRLYRENGLAVGTIYRYEIVLRARPLGERPKMYEFTFDGLGRFLKKELIVFRNADHLEY